MIDLCLKYSNEISSVQYAFEKDLINKEFEGFYNNIILLRM